MEMILTTLNVAGGIVAGVFSVMCFELLRVLTGRKVDMTVEALRRRLADVEALRRAEQGKLQSVPGVYSPDQGRCMVPPAGWDCTREPGHDGPCAAIPSMIRDHLGEPPFTGGMADEFGDRALPGKPGQA